MDRVTDVVVGGLRRLAEEALAAPQMGVHVKPEVLQSLCAEVWHHRRQVELEQARTDFPTTSRDDLRRTIQTMIDNGELRLDETQIRAVVAQELLNTVKIRA